MVPCELPIFKTKDNLPAKDYPAYSKTFYPNVIKLGGIFNIFNINGLPDPMQAQCLAAFLLAVKEINADKSILPNTQIVTGVVRGLRLIGSSDAARKLAHTYFGGTGVDIVVSAGGDLETDVTNQIFAQTHIIQVNGLAQSVDLFNGALYPTKLQITPLRSYQGLFSYI